MLAVQIKWGIEKEKDVFSVYVENISGEDCHLDLLHAVSIETFVEGNPLCGMQNCCPITPHCAAPNTGLKASEICDIRAHAAPDRYTSDCLYSTPLPVAHRRVNDMIIVVDYWILHWGRWFFAPFDSRGIDQRQQRVCHGYCAGTRHYHETGELPKWGKPPERDGVGLLHCSPPCQGLSKLNTWTDEARVEEGLFPVLDQVRTPPLHSLAPPRFYVALLSLAFPVLDQVHPSPSCIGATSFSCFPSHLPLLLCSPRCFFVLRASCVAV